MMVAVASVSMAAGARANTYALTLTDTLYGPEDGNGFLTVNGPVTTGVFTSNGGGLTSLSIAIDGQTYNLTNAVGTAEATFVNGSLSNLSYLGISDGINLSLASTGLFYFYTDLSNWSLSSAGTISATATPLPPTAVLFAGALVILLVFSYRQRIFGRGESRTGVIPIG
jgi:hypothetical protein